MSELAQGLVMAGLGAIMGSFANVAIHRLPQGRSEDETPTIREQLGRLVSPRSRCPHCGHPIRGYDNIPLVSFLLLRGRCRDCRRPIGWRYPLVEALTALIFIGVWRTFGFSGDALRPALLSLLLVIVIFIDMDHRIIPDAVTYPGLALGLVLALGQGFRTFLEAFLSAAGAAVFFFLIAEVSYAVLRQVGMGGGDIKLAAVVGAFLGWPGVATALLGSFITGGLFAVGLMLAGRRRRREAIPFGPWLALGAFIALFWGNAIVRWYLG